MVDIQPAAAEIRRGIKKKIEEERNNRMKILWSALLHRATIITVSLYLTQVQLCYLLKLCVMNFVPIR